MGVYILNNEKTIYDEIDSFSKFAEYDIEYKPRFCKCSQEIH